MTSGKTYALAHMFRLWVEQVRNTQDVALLISKTPAEADRFIKICAELTGLGVETGGRLVRGDQVVAYAVSGIIEVYATYRFLCTSLIPVSLVIGADDPLLGFFNVSTWEDPVDSDGLYKAVPKST